MNTNDSLFMSGEAKSENTFFGVNERIKKKIICFYALNCNNLVYSNASALRTEIQLFSYLFASKLMLSACLLDMILVGNTVCNWETDSNNV